MKFLLLILFSALYPLEVFASYERRSLDIKTPNQILPYKQSFINIADGTAINMLDDFAGDTGSGAVTTTNFLSQPDVARSILVTPVGTTADVAAGNIALTGVDILGAVITENLAVTSGQSIAVESTKTYRSITSIQFPVEASPYGALWDVGFGDRLGLNDCLSGSAYFSFLELSGASETVSSLNTSSSVVSLNYFKPTNLPDGARDYGAVFYKTWLCGN
jgi:hypothetical protein